MAVTATYHDLTDFKKIYFFDESAGTFTSVKASNMDYFPDDAVAGDALYFCMYSMYNLYDEIEFNVGTALVADAITLAWEFWSDKDGAWKALPNVVDDTTNFTVLGVNTVTWDVDATLKEWGAGCDAPRPPSYSNYLLVRCRISAVTNLTEGGANTGSYSPRCRPRTIWLVGTASKEYGCWATLYGLDVAGSWGVITRTGPDSKNYVYTVDAQVYWNSGAHFASKQETVIFNTDYAWYMYGSRTLTLGEMIESGDAELNIERGAYWFFSNTFRGPLNFWGTLEMRGSIIRCMVVSDPNYNRQSFALSSTNATLVDSIIYTYGRFTLGGTKTYTFLRSHLSAYTSNYISPGDLPDTAATALDFGSSRLDAQVYCAYNGWMRDFSAATLTLSGGATDVSVINGVWENLNLQGANSDLDAYYTLDITVTDEDGGAISGATITVKDKDGTEESGSPATTDANGESGEILCRHKNYHGANEAETTYTPHIVTISKAGYIKKEYTLTMDQERDEVEVLIKVKDLNYSKQVKMMTQ